MLYFRTNQNGNSNSKFLRILEPTYFFISTHFYWISREYGRAELGLNLTILCRAAIPEGSNFSIFDHSFKFTYEGL
jgi:hypothetical protein